MTPQHWNFVIAAYAVTVLAIAALVIWLVRDHRDLKRRLAAMDGRATSERQP